MRLLDDASPDVEVDESVIFSTPKKIEDKDHLTLLKILLERRPELSEIELELTCENAQTLVPYIKLVNRVLEDYIRRANTDKFHVREVEPSPHSPQSDPEYEVYQKCISKQMYPFAYCLYVPARPTVQEYLNC